MDDKYQKRFEVGDVIVPLESQKYVFQGYRFEGPYTVSRVWNTGPKWYLVFQDINGRGVDGSGWFHWRFESAYKGYDPKQTGDTDDDI